MIAALYIAITAYLSAGFVFALPFAFAGAQRLLSEPAPMTFGARLAVIPGAVMLWPWLLKRWLSSAKDQH